MKVRGVLYIVSAPSGAGKTSLLKSVVAETPDLRISVSHTTRLQRLGEQDGVDYHFVEQAEFAEMIQKDAFLEHAEVFGNFYGTSKGWVESQLASGTDIILEIDWQGARQIRQIHPLARSIFILPPSLETLRSRLTGRGQDAVSVIDGRMEKAQQEISHYHEYDYIIVNDDFELAQEQLRSVFIAERQTLRSQQQRHEQLINNLLA